jgi:hypothetical protein
VLASALWTYSYYTRCNNSTALQLIDENGKR